MCSFPSLSPKKYSDHYYDKSYQKLHFYANHDMDMELKLWQHLHKLKLINLYMRKWMRWPHLDPSVINSCLISHWSWGVLCCRQKPCDVYGLWILLSQPNRVSMKKTDICLLPVNHFSNWKSVGVALAITFNSFWHKMPYCKVKMPTVGLIFVCECVCICVGLFMYLMKEALCNDAFNTVAKV